MKLFKPKYINIFKNNPHLSPFLFKTFYFISNTGFDSGALVHSNKLKTALIQENCISVLWKQRHKVGVLNK